MGELTTDSTRGGSTPAAAPTAESVAHDRPQPPDRMPRGASAQPGLVEGATRGSRLVGLVVARDDTPSVVEQRNDLASFGVGILDLKHPTPEARRRGSSGSAGRSRRCRRATCSWAWS
jgi:hypothetical protein